MDEFDEMELIDSQMTEDVAGSENEESASESELVPKTSLADFFEEPEGIVEEEGEPFFVPKDDIETSHKRRPRPSGTSEGETKKVDIRKLPMVPLLVGVAVVLACVCGAYVAFSAPQNEVTVVEEPKVEAPPREEPKPVEVVRAAVVLPVDIVGLDEQGSRIPVRVVGQQVDGTAVNVEGFVAFDGSGLELAPGTYDVTVLETPISIEGVLFAIPSEALHITVAEGGQVISDPADARLNLWAITASDVTNERVESARSWIAKDPQKSAIADTLAAHALERLDEAQNDKDNNDANNANANNDTDQASHDNQDVWVQYEAEPHQEVNSDVQVTTQPAQQEQVTPQPTQQEPVATQPVEQTQQAQSEPAQQQQAAQEQAPAEQPTQQNATTQEQSAQNSEVSGIEQVAEGA